MKKITEQIGKTTEEAIRKGLEDLKVSRDDVKIEILEEPSSGGVLGILSAKMAKVRLTVDKKISDEQFEKTATKVKEILSNIFRITGESDIEYTVDKKENQVLIKLNGSMLQREDEEYAKVFVEINDYKKQKEEKLRKLADKMANNVIKFRKPIRLEPMSAYERLIIHTELASRDDVETESIGEEPRRRVVIKKKYN